MKMVWNVFLYDERRDSRYTPEKFNIFQNCSFKKAVEELFSIPEQTREQITSEIRRLAMWQFWSRCQYEFILLSWPPRDGEQGYKMDVFEQLEMNWERFIDYVWDCYCFGTDEDDE